MESLKSFFCIPYFPVQEGEPELVVKGKKVVPKEGEAPAEGKEEVQDDEEEEDDDDYDEEDDEEGDGGENSLDYPWHLTPRWAHCL